MGLITSHRFVVSGGLPSGTGQQAVSGTLNISGGATIYFGSDVWAGAVTSTPYVIFTYGTLTGSASTNLTADAASLTALGFSSASFADTGASNGQITVTFS